MQLLAADGVQEVGGSDPLTPTAHPTKTFVRQLRQAKGLWILSAHTFSHMDRLQIPNTLSPNGSP